MGLALRYRPVEALGLELQWNYHDQSWTEGSDRIQQPISASAEVFALPWTRFSPYVLAGVTMTPRNIDDQVDRLTTVESNQAAWGPHLGVGLELGLSDQVSLNFDLRGIGYLNLPASDPARNGATQANMGLNFYF